MKIRSLGWSIPIAFIFLAPRGAHAQGAPHFICGNEPVPTGWVVTALYPSNYCTGTATQAPTRLIEDSTGKVGMFACDGSPVPSGRITTIFRNVGWCSGDPNVFQWTRQIEPSADKQGFFACEGSTIADGWVVSRRMLTDYCSRGAGLQESAPAT